MPTAPTTLDYAPSLPFYKRRRFRRAMLVVTILLGLLVLTYLSRNWIRGRYHRMLEIYFQQACMNHTPAQGQIAYSEEPATVIALATTADYRVLQNSLWRSFSPDVPPFQYIVHTPEYLRDFNKHLFAYYSALKGHELSAGDGFGPLVYMHRLKDPAAKEEFLATVSFSHHSNSAVIFAVTVKTPETMFGEPKVLSADTIGITLQTAPGQLTKRSLRIYEAAPDSSDGMSFTLTYEIDGVAGHIRGEFKPQSHIFGYPRLELKIVDGPLMP